ncbi:MAG TPA: SpoIID/LytB domain-containing protein [Acidimicrobiales bacterium]|nr:SpoIID/LytB domain-containing protein [Acidimicrobiales bacterium]
MLAGSLRARPKLLPRRLGSTLVLGLVLSLPGATALLGGATPAAAYPTSSVVLNGHGYGHGIGMSQWGSLGYALGADGGAGNFTYQQILSHYYGNASLQTLGVGPAPAAFNSGNVLVAMTEVNGNDAIVTAQSGNVNYPGGSATAVRFAIDSSGTYTIYTSGGCGGDPGPTPWTQVATGVNKPTATAANGGPVFLCGPNFTLHGALTAEPNSVGSPRTVNTLPLEQYVADVAPAESPSSWAGLGGAGPQGQPWGFQQSEAQTVAARSYVESNPGGYGGYADICDSTACQAYPGMADETQSSRDAATATAGQVMLTASNTVANTEYSSSSGGYSTGGQFPAVLDSGDAICIPSACNPHHNWSASIPVSTIDAAYSQIGTLSALTVTSRNGLGDFGGRVEQLTLEGSNGSVSMTGDAFAAAFNLQSDWFTVGDQPSGGVGGYWINATDGGVFSFGNASFHGSTGNITLNKPVVGMTGTHDAGGYWEVASDGGVFSFGDATFHGSTGNITLNKPMVGMAATPSGGGYWLVASDGGVFSFGDATFHGSTGSLKLNRPIVGMVPTHDGGGYWLIASDGGLFAFGNAAFHGSLGNNPPPTPIVGVAPSADGGGYWMLEANATVHAFGDAPSVPPGGSSPGIATANSPMSAMIPDFSGGGFDVVDQTGQAFSFGDAPYFGDVATTIAGYSGRVVGIAVTPG